MVIRCSCPELTIASVTESKMPVIARKADQDTVLIRTVVVSVSIKIAAITVGIATIKPVESESASKATSAAKMPATETTGELLDSFARRPGCSRIRRTAPLPRSSCWLILGISAAHLESLEQSSKAAGPPSPLGEGNA
jgi:hypothetical protein